MKPHQIQRWITLHSTIFLVQLDHWSFHYEVIPKNMCFKWPLGYIQIWRLHKMKFQVIPGMPGMAVWGGIYGKLTDIRWYYCTVGSLMLGGLDVEKDFEQQLAEVVRKYEHFDNTSGKEFVKGHIIWLVRGCCCCCWGHCSEKNICQTQLSSCHLEKSSRVTRKSTRGQGL